MNELREKWFEALESGNYKQGKDFLRNEDKYCCLGVLCEIAGMDKSPSGQGFVNNGVVCDVFPPQRVCDMVGFKAITNRQTGGGILSTMNDKGKSFKDIVKFCRENSGDIFNDECITTEVG